MGNMPLHSPWRWSETTRQAIKENGRYIKYIIIVTATKTITTTQLYGGGSIGGEAALILLACKSR